MFNVPSEWNRGHHTPLTATMKLYLVEYTTKPIVQSSHNSWWWWWSNQTFSYLPIMTLCHHCQGFPLLSHYLLSYGHGHGNPHDHFHKSHITTLLEQRNPHHYWSQRSHSLLHIKESFHAPPFYQQIWIRIGRWYCTEKPWEWPLLLFIIFFFSRFHCQMRLWRSHGHG